MSTTCGRPQGEGCQSNVDSCRQREEVSNVISWGRNKWMTPQRRRVIMKMASIELLSCSVFGLAPYENGSVLSPWRLDGLQRHVTMTSGITFVQFVST